MVHLPHRNIATSPCLPHSFPLLAEVETSHPRIQFVFRQMADCFSSIGEGICPSRPPCRFSPSKPHPRTMSLLTIEASSTIIVSIIFTKSRFSSENLITVRGPITERGKPKNECIVCPPALMAAIPVGASTKKFLPISFKILLMKVVLPVPALPVINRLTLVLATRSNACCCSLLSLSAMKSVCAIATIFLLFVCKGTGLVCSDTSQQGIFLYL